MSEQVSHDELKDMTRQLFSSPIGKKVLATWKRIYSSGMYVAGDSDSTAYRLGQWEFVQNIERAVEE